MHSSHSSQKKAYIWVQSVVHVSNQFAMSCYRKYATLSCTHVILKLKCSRWDPAKKKKREKINENEKVRKEA